MDIKVYNRNSEKIETIPQYMDSSLNFLYNTCIGRFFLKTLITTPMLSKIYGGFNNTKLSKLKIKSFIKNYNIDMSEYKTENFQSFNDFFSRKIVLEKRPLSTNEHDLAAIADSKLTVFDIDSDLNLKIKQSVYTIDELTADKSIAHKYKNGKCLVFRLCVNDYHRYMFLDNGTLKSTKYIKGVLHTVSPISQKKYKIYAQNSRVCSVLHTENFDDVVQIEVGALMVGKIRNHNLPDFKKGDEKGYFLMGGSTIVLLFKENVIKIDEDIITCSKNSIETIVKYGEKIGKKYL